VTSTAPIELPEEFLREPAPLYEQLRDQGPVHHVRLPAGLRGWLVTDYTVARQVLADPTIRKDVHQIRRIIDTTHPGVHAMGSDMAEHMLNTDPPGHTRLRRLVAKAFTPRSVSALVPRIEQIADELIAAMPTTGPVDLLSEFAFPLPITVLCELLGIPTGDRDQFRTWTNTILFAGTDSRETVLAAAADMNTYLHTLIVARREHPGDDMLSGLVTATDQDGNLTDTEVVSMTFLLLVAGHETTVNLIGNTMLTLLQDQARFTALRTHPDQVPPALEEHLRHLGPVHIATLRFTTEPGGPRWHHHPRGRARLRVPCRRQPRPEPVRSPRARRLRTRKPRPSRVRARHPRLPRRPPGTHRRHHRHHPPARPLPTHDPRHRPRGAGMAD